MPINIESTLDKLLATKYETETIEFKEAKDSFSFDELGKYFSALSNEANLHNEECAWLVFGVEDKKHIIVGTNYRNDAKSLNSLKEEIGKQTSENLTFIEIYECFRKVPDYDFSNHEVRMNLYGPEKWPEKCQIIYDASNGGHWEIVKED